MARSVLPTSASRGNVLFLLLLVASFLVLPTSASAVSDSLILRPDAGDNPIGTTHTLTATVTDGGAPVANVQVGFFGQPGSVNFVFCQETNDFFTVTGANGQAVCTYAGSNGGTDTILAFADTNSNRSFDTGEPSDTATKRWRTPPATRLTLTPAAETNIVDTEQCVEAQADNDTGPAGDQTVSFTVTGANPQAAEVVTNASGFARFCYTGTDAGLDTITAFVDSNDNNTRDASEPRETATKRWLATQPAITLEQPPGDNPIGTTHTLTATVTDGGAPVANVQVGFFGQPGSVNFVFCQETNDFFTVTGANGQAVCTYAGSNGGTDTILAFADTNSNRSFDTGEPSDTATKRWRTPPATRLTLTPAAETNIVDTEQCVEAQADNDTGPAGDQTVSFTVTGANPQAAEVVTNASGFARFCYTGTDAGLDTITAFVDSNDNNTRDASEPRETATKRWLATQPAITLEQPPGDNPIGTTHTLTATVTDGGAPVANVQVGFFGQPGSVNFVFCQETNDFFTVTGANGQAVCTYAGSNGGTDTILAFADTNSNRSFDTGEPSDTATKRWRTPPATRLTLTPAAETNIVDTEQCVEAQADNDTGPAGDQTVSFTVTGANPQAAEVVTNASGFARFCYTGTDAGLDTITAFVDSNDNNTRDASEPRETATKRWLATQPAITLEQPPGDNPIGTTHTLTATVTDGGAPVANVQVGFFGQPGSVNFVFCQETNDFFTVTGANGQAVCTYAGSNGGTDTILAFADTNSNRSFDTGEPSDTATKTWTDNVPATSLSLTPPAATNVVDVQHCVTAVARLESGNPAPNKPVRFTVTGANPEAETDLTTDSGGATQFCYTGTSAGLDSITAFVDNDRDGQRDPSEPQTTATKRWLAQPPDSLVLTPPNATNPTNTQHILVATVTDGGNPIPNVKVVFQIRDTSQSDNKLTDADGKATFSYSRSFEGTDTIDAFADTNGNGTRDPDEPLGTATKQWTVQPPSLLILTQPSATNPINTEHCVTATVSDATGRLQGNRTVRFSVSGVNGPMGGAATTDFAGTVRFCYTGTLPGDDTISAFADTNNDQTQDVGEPGDTVTKTWTGAALTIADASVTEGDSGQTESSFTVTLSSAATEDVTVELRDRRRHRYRPGRLHRPNGHTHDPGR